MVIDYDEAWSKYNKLANQLRESIAFKAKKVLNIGEIEEFRFEDYGLEVYTGTVGNTTIQGLIKEDNEIKIIVANELAIEDNVSMYNEQIHLLDLLGILENIDNYGG